MTYCSTTEVYAVAGITSAEVSAADVTMHIKVAEKYVDRITGTTWWHTESSGTATAATATTLTDSGKTWTASAYIYDYVYIVSGTGAGQMRQITANTTTQLTVATWTVTPDVTSVYAIIHTGTNPIKTDTFSSDGYQPSAYWVTKYPIVETVSISIDAVSQTVADVWVDEDEGKITLGNGNATNRWSAKVQGNVVAYYFGVYETPFDELVSKLTANVAATYVLSQQMGGTFDAPSTFSLPEGSVSVGQAYINIKGTLEELRKTITILEGVVRKYPYLG